MSSEPPRYELQAQGREPRMYEDAALAGAAFFAAKREEMPKVLMHEQGGHFHVAMTARDPRDPSGYSHLFLEAPSAFKQGYDQAKQAMPDRVVAVQDMAPAQPPTQQGPSVSEKPAAAASAAAASVPPAAPAPQPAKPAAPEAVNFIELAPPRTAEPQKPAPAPAPQATQRDKLLQSLAERFEVASVGTLLKPVDEYRIGGDKGSLRVAFTDHGKRLSSEHDTPEVVRGMVDLAQAKGWREIDAKGTLEFRRSTWHEATLRGIHVTGYVPSPQDEERLKAARAQQQPAQQAVPREKPSNTIEAAPAPQPGNAQEQPRSGPTREQWLQMTRSVLKDMGHSKDEIEKTVKVMAQKVDALLAAGGKLPPIQVYDKTAPSRAPVPTAVPQPAPQPGHSREVEAPGR
jgi:chemotaxis protein histidine kinase CheA